MCDLMICPKREYQKDFKHQKIHLAWRQRRNSVGGVCQWRKWRGVSSLQKCLPYSERSTVLAGTAFSNTHTFHPALQIYDHTHVIIHAALLECVRMKCVCRHNEFRCMCILEYKSVYVFLRCVHKSRQLKTETQTERTGTMVCTSLKGLICICILI